MNMLMTLSTRSSVYCAAVVALMACNRGADSRQASAPPAQDSHAVNPAAPITVRGAVVSASAGEIVLKGDSGTVTVKVAQPFHVYTRVPSDMSQVKATTFIGVTTVKQPDGSEQATEIHIFPEELRGLGEGSRMMTETASATPSRMTNGAVTTSRMSNGNVATTNGSTLLVEYPGGSQAVTVPPNTPVTELKLASKDLVAGDQAVALVTKAPDGSFTSSTVILTTK